MKIVNDIRITKYGKEVISKLLINPLVDKYHKTLLRAIDNRGVKNVSKSDCDILETIVTQYGGII